MPKEISLERLHDLRNAAQAFIEAVNELEEETIREQEGEKATDGQEHTTVNPE